MKRSFAKIRFMLPVLFRSAESTNEVGRGGPPSSVLPADHSVICYPVHLLIPSSQCSVIQPTWRQWIFYFSFSSIRYQASSCKQGVTCDSRSLILRLLRSPRDPLAHAAL